MLIIYFIHLIVQKIYRCWIVWGYSIRVVIVPSILALAFLGPLIYLHSLTHFNLWFLAVWIAQGAAPTYFLQGQLDTTLWSLILVLAGLILPMTVNALVTGMIVFRIFKVFQEVKIGTADDQILGMTSGSKLRCVIFILIGSGMALFSIQLAQFVVATMCLVTGTNASFSALVFLIDIHEMLNVIIRSVIATLFY